MCVKKKRKESLNVKDTFALLNPLILEHIKEIIDLPTQTKFLLYWHLHSSRDNEQCKPKAPWGLVTGGPGLETREVPLTTGKSTKHTD